MREAIHEAGWPAYPIIVLALSCLFISLRHALIPQRSLVPLIVGTGVAALLFGALGTCLGLQHAASGLLALPADERWIVFVGLKEALNDLDLALFPTLAAALLTGIGSWRLALREAAAHA